MRRWLAALLCLTLLAGSAPACGQEVVPAQTEAPVAEETQRPAEEDALPPSTDAGSTSAPADQAPDSPAEALPSEDVQTETTPEAPAADADDAPSPEPTAAPSNAPAAEPTSEPEIEPTIEPTTEPTDEPTIEPTTEPAAGPSVEASPEPTAEPTAEPTPVPDPPEISLKKTQRSVYANEEAIGLQLKIEGGAAAYSVVYSVVLDAQTVAQAEYSYAGAGKYSFSHMANSAGEYTIRAVVTDANGMTAEASVNMPVAARDPYNGWAYMKAAQAVELTGDWREDFLAVARTQIGYRQSDTDFYIDEDGNRRSFTFYGEWYGARYAGWCGMFVSYCLHMAGISSEDFPYEANAVHWRAIMLERGAYMDDEYEYMPEPGDLVFFNSGPLRNNMPEHMGIVDKVEDGVITVIEGNVESYVKHRKYPMDHRRIIGYVSLAVLIEQAEQGGVSAADAAP